MDNIPAVSTSEKPHHSAELRIVLIGGRQIHGKPSHKSATGNIILGKSVFETDKRTAQSVVGQQKVHGRKVTVVDTPGWWWHYPLENTPKLDQIEITNSIHLCAPGPHAFLLVIPVGLFFPEIFKHSLEEHLKLFQEGVFKHTIVLFTAEAPCREENLKQTSNWSALQWVLTQCGNRQHFFNISDKQDSTQVMKLFEKIEAMVAENVGGYCSIDRAAGNALRQEIQGITERASKRSDEVQTQRRELRALIEGGKTPPAHLRLVMVGAQGSAKSSAGNCILGKDAFAVQVRLRTTKCCEMSHSMVAGRKVTVVDSPGWFYNHTLQDTCKRDKLEIENSMNLCPPGPHAVLLMVGLASAFNESYQRSVQEHMSLFTDDIWKHTVVVFTRGEWLGGKTVEERIESEEGLQRLVEKCGNRYHVLSNSKHSNEMQVTELLEKIEETWAGNKDPHYKADVQRAEAIEAGKEAEDKMAKRIWQITQRQSRILKELFKGETRPITDLRVVLVGRKESGKSMAGNTLLLQELFDSHWMKKEFQHKRETMTCVKHQRDVAGVNTTVVETPGWFTHDTVTPDWLKDEVVRGVSLCAPGPHVFLLVVPISKAFMEGDRKAMVELLKPFGETVWRYCMVLFTWGDWLNNTSIEEHIAGEGKPLQWLVEKCHNRYHVVTFYWCFTRTLFHKINELNMCNKGHCFSAAQTDTDKQKKKRKLPWQVKQPELTEEEWNRREQELIDRVLKAVQQEPSELIQPLVKMTASMDGFCVPSMSEGAPSEYGSAFWTLRGRTMVSEWLNKRVTDSDITSGLGSISAAASYMANLDEIHLTDEDHQPTPCFLPEKHKVKFNVPLQMRVSTDTVETRRRYSF